MFKTVKTVYLEQLEVNRDLGLPYAPLQNTTLNEKFNITATSSEEYPTLQYYTIGLHYKSLTDVNNLDFNKIQHSTLDSSVYIPIPFLLKEANVGLTDLEKSKYFLRTKLTINNTEFIACYGKKIDSIANDSKLYDIVKDDTYGVELLSIPDNRYLNPIPRENIDIYGTKLNYVAVSLKLKVTIDKIEALNIRNAINLLYPNRPDTNKYEIGEIGFVFGKSGVSNGDSEIADAQIGYFLKSNMILNDLILDKEEVLTAQINIGGMKPYLK